MNEILKRKSSKASPPSIFLVKSILGTSLKVREREQYKHKTKLK